MMRTTHCFASLALCITASCVGVAPDPIDDEQGSASSSDDTGSGNEDQSSGEEDSTGGGSGSGATGALEAVGTWKVLNHDYQVQSTGYWCGPAAARVAISTRMPAPSQGALAAELGTDEDGTDYIGQVTSVLNQHLGPRYATVELPNDPPTPAQRDQLWRDIVLSIDAGHALIANIVAPATNHPPGYPNYTIYHYFAVIGYNPQTREAYIADSANFSGNQHYWLAFDQLATLIPPKGYSTYRCGVGRTQGLINDRYQSLGGCGSFLGPALTDEIPTPDGVGRYNVFDNGSIYWSPSTGAFEVHGAIRDKYKELGWEAGLLGYPISNETKTPDNIGRFSVFQTGSIYWTAQTGAHEVHGAIRDKYKELGWEAGSLGYPTSDEYPVAGGNRSDFQHGTLTFNTSSKTVTAAISK